MENWASQLPINFTLHATKFQVGNSEQVIKLIKNLDEQESKISYSTHDFGQKITKKNWRISLWIQL